jgi:signal transduction histidine kinase
MEDLTQAKNLVQRSYWLIRLRWLAIAGLILAVFTAERVMKVSLPTSRLYILALILFFYNFVLYDLMQYLTWKGRIPPPAHINRVIGFQMSADLVILTAILHFSGGVENPFFLYFVFHTILASIMLSRLHSYLQATFAVLLFGGLVYLEYLQVIPHYELRGFVTHSHYREGLFVFGTLFVFTTTIYLVVYMTSFISEQLRRQQRELGAAIAQLKQKDNLKNEYVLRLTHDIKGHLAAVQSCLDIVVGQLVGPLNEKQMNLIERAHRRTGKCVNFTTALLKLTRMKLTGQLEMAYFPVRNAVFNALAAVERRAKKKAITISQHIDEGVDEIYGEALLIEETITNILFNAARYTPNGGAIQLRVEDEGASIIIKVKDTGIGIPEQDIERIFEEFYRAENARQVERDGTGLGLSIAKQAVERHNGQIWAENNPEGGSTFSIRLPKKPGGS